MFSGFTSRCTTLTRWAARSARADGTMIGVASGAAAPAGALESMINPTRPSARRRGVAVQIVEDVHENRRRLEGEIGVVLRRRKGVLRVEREVAPGPRHELAERVAYLVSER